MDGLGLTLINSVITISENAKGMSFHRRFMDGYLEWFFRVSHTHIIPHIQPTDDDGGLSDDVSPP